MIVHYGQIYIQAGINFPFTHLFQLRMSELVSARVECTDQFIKKYGQEWEIMLRISAKSELKDVEIKGPTVYRKDKDVECTIFLPYDVIHGNDSWQSMAIESIIDATSTVLVKLGLKSESLMSNKNSIVRDILSKESMIKG